MVSQTMSDETETETACNGFKETAERLERNERVRYTTPDGNEVTGTVCKSNRGGIRVLPDGGHLLHVIKTGCILSTVNRDGGALRRRSRKGRLKAFEILNETGNVTYEDNNGGWVHVPEEVDA